MRRKVLLLIQFLHGLLVLTSVFSGIAMLLGVFGLSTEVYFVHSLLLLAAYAATAIAEKKIRGIGVFLLISIASVLPAVLLAPDLVSRIVFILIGVIIIAIRIVGRVRDSGTILDSPHMAVVALFAVFFIIAAAVENRFVSTLNYYLAFAYLIMILIYTNFLNLEGYLTVNKDVQNIPVKKIGRTNNLMLLGYLGLTVTIMILMPIFGLDRAVAKLGQGILALIRFLASLRKGGEEVVDATLPEEGGGGDMGGQMPNFGETNETPLWLEALYHALTVVLIVVVAILVIAIIAVAVYRLVKAFYKPIRENSDEQEFINPEDDNREFAEPQGGFFRRIREIVDPTPTASVRRIYRKRIKKQKKDFSEAMTPQEIESAVGLPEGTPRQILHEVYEKARYSANGCTEQDLTRLKKGAEG